MELFLKIKGMSKTLPENYLQKLGENNTLIITCLAHPPIEFILDHLLFLQICKSINTRVPSAGDNISLEPIYNSKGRDIAYEQHRLTRNDANPNNSFLQARLVSCIKNLKRRGNFQRNKTRWVLQD